MVEAKLEAAKLTNAIESLHTVLAALLSTTIPERVLAEKHVSEVGHTYSSLLTTCPRPPSPLAFVLPSSYFGACAASSGADCCTTSLDSSQFSIPETIHTSTRDLCSHSMIEVLVELLLRRSPHRCLYLHRSPLPQRRLPESPSGSSSEVWLWVWGCSVSPRRTMQEVVHCKNQHGH